MNASKNPGKDEVISKALDIVTLVVNQCDSEVSRGFRTRTRQEITSIAFQGLQFALAVIAARSSAKALEEALKNVDPNAFIRGVCTDENYRKDLGLERAEDVAYALYGYAILYILKSLGYIPSGSFTDFIKSKSASSVLYEFAIQSATWLKRFAEAYIKGA